MVKENVRISDFHFDHKLWMNELKFFEMQLDVFEERLEEVVPNLDRAAMAEVEVFQNKIIRQREVTDELKHKFRLRDAKLSNFSSDQTIETDNVLFAEHRSEREEMQIYIKLYQEMREKYMSFLERYT